MPETLDSVCELIVDCVNRTAPEDAEGTYLLVGTPAMRGNVIDRSSARRVNAATFATWTRRLLPRAGDLLLAREAPVGPVVMIPEGGHIGAGQRTTHLRADRTKVHNRFLYYLLIAPETQERLLNRAMGSTVAHLRVADLKSFELPFLPSLPEQQAIAEVLGALDDKIAANTALVTASDELVRAEYSTLNAGRVRVADVADSPRSGVDPSSVNPQDLYVGLEHVGRRHMWLTDGGHAEEVSSTKSRFQTRDILFGKLRPYFHKVVSAPRDGICSTDILVVRARIPRLSSVLLAALTSDAVIEEVVAASEGTRMPRTSWKDLASVEIQWPDDESADYLAARLDEIRDATLAVLAENRTLAATRDALLPQLMSGKLRVRDAEAMASEAGA